MTGWTCGYCEASVLLSAQGNGSIRLQLLSVPTLARPAAAQPADNTNYQDPVTTTLG